MKLNLLLLAFLSFGLFSCGDDEGDDKTTVSIEMQLDLDGDVVDYTDSYFINETEVKFNYIGMYVGDVSFNISGQTFTNATNRYFLLENNSINFNLGEVAGTQLENVAFGIGVDAATNDLTEMDYNEREPDDVLGPQDPSMHWTWDAGYRFIRIDASADLDGDGTFETDLAYHVGKDEFYNSVSKNVSLQIEEGTNEFDIDIDVRTLLSGIDFSSDLSTHTFDNLPLAEKVSNNAVTAVKVTRD